MEKPTANQIASLEAQIRHYQRAYYDLNAPEISDSAFDLLWEQLKKIAPDSVVLNERSQAFDSDFQHKVPMGSLAKCKTVAELYKKFKGKVVTITSKIDGASNANHYDDKRLTFSVTRGRTETGKGKVVTANADEIPSIPKHIEYDGKLEVRGEIVIKTSDWVKIQDQFSNARSAASGGLQCKSTADTRSRLLSYICYKTVMEEPTGTHEDTLKMLKGLGFTVPIYDVLCVTSEAVMQKAIDEWAIKRKALDYVTDGIVIRLNDEKEYMEAGMTGACWNGGSAFKYENQGAETTIRDISWEPSRIGFITPVAHFDAIDLGGTKIEKCTLNNPTWMTENGNPSIGSKVVIERMNDVIPNLVETLTPGTGNTNQPKDCPSCGAPLVFAETNDGDGAKLKCTGDDCPAKKQGTILNSLKKFEIKGIADKNLEKMTEAGLLKEPWEIFDLTVPKLVAAGWGKRESEIIVEAIKGVEAKPTHILAAIGLEMWGRRMFEQLLDNSKSFTEDRLLAGDFPYDELAVVRNIGPARAKVLSDAFQDGSYARKYLSELLKRVKPVKSEAKPVGAAGGKLAGRQFCLSGSMSRGKKQIGDDIAAAGGVVKDGVSRDLSFLVAGEGSGSKSEKAAKYGIKILSEDELYSMIG